MAAGNQRSTDEKSNPMMHLKKRLRLNNTLWLYLVLGGLFALLPLLASRTEKPAPVTLALPAGFPAGFTQYATVQRPDGTLRDLYINSAALSSYIGGYTLPNGSILVIAAYNAERTTDGAWLTDTDGRYQRGEAFGALHLRAKRPDWPDSTFADDTRNGDWNYGSFTTAGEAYPEPLTLCFQCHSTAETPDFTYSFSLLAKYKRTGQVVYSFCDQTGRTPC